MGEMMPERAGWGWRAVALLKDLASSLAAGAIVWFAQGWVGEFWPEFGVFAMVLALTIVFQLFFSFFGRSARADRAEDALAMQDRFRRSKERRRA